MTSPAAGLVPALCGRRLGSYQLDSFIGGGGFGLVFSASDVSTGTHVAVKVLTPTTSTQAVAEFETEGSLLRKLAKCEGVVTLIDSGTAPLTMMTDTGIAVSLPLSYLVLDLASAGLHELTQDPSKLAELAWSERISIWRGAVKGIHQMHLKNVAHRDIKAENCLLVFSGDRSDVQVADLGRSKDFSSDPTLSMQDYLAGRGDLRYAPPELLWHQGGSSGFDFRSADIYGLGSLLTELITGHPMTALALGSWQEVFQQGEIDLAAGTRRDLTTLRPQFRRAIDEAVDQLPKPIRKDCAVMLTQLCDPVPMVRLARHRRKKRLVTDPGLNWLIQKADIVTKKAVLEEKKESVERRFERSA